MLASAIAYMDKERKSELDVYEATAKLSEIGAGIHLWRRAYEMLVKIGLEKDIVELCERANDSSCEILSTSVAATTTYVKAAQGFQFRKGDQKDGHRVYDLHVNGKWGVACSL